jgi:hypothetical protein
VGSAATGTVGLLRTQLAQRLACLQAHHPSNAIGDYAAQIMRPLVSLRFGLSLLLVAIRASAADRRVNGWTTG